MFKTTKDNPSKKLKNGRRLLIFVSCCCMTFFLTSVILLYKYYDCSPEHHIVIDKLKRLLDIHEDSLHDIHEHSLHDIHKPALHDIHKPALHKKTPLLNTRVTRTRQQPAKRLNEATNSLDMFEKCSWSGHKYLYPYWDNPVFENTVRALNEAGVIYFLTDGALIGAYRHGGPVPCDGDMDIVFPVWLNGIATCEDAATPVLRGYEKNDESLLTLCGKTREEYVSEGAAWLRKHVPNIHSIAPREFGGLRVNFAGIGVDWIVSILDQSYLHKGPICRCLFGSTEALCIEDSLWLIKSIYGENVLTPLPNIQKCIDTRQTILQKSKRTI